MREILISGRHLDTVMKAISDLLQAGEVRSVTTPTDAWDGYRYIGRSSMELERKTGIQVMINIEHELDEDRCQMEDLKPYLNVLGVGEEIKGSAEIISLPYLSKIKLAGGFVVNLDRLIEGKGMAVVNTKEPLFGARNQTISFFSFLGATLEGVNNGKK